MSTLGGSFDVFFMCNCRVSIKNYYLIKIICLHTVKWFQVFVRSIWPQNWGKYSLKLFKVLWQTCTWPIDGTLIDITSLGQRKPRSNDEEKHTSHSPELQNLSLASRFCLAYPGHHFMGRVYSSSGDTVSIFQVPLISNLTFTIFTITFLSPRHLRINFLDSPVDALGSVFII